MENNNLLLVEFTGCTSVGKSTLIPKILSQLHSRGIKVLLGDEFVLSYYGLPIEWFSQHLVRSVVIDLLTLPWYLTALPRYWDFWKLVFGICSRDVDSFLFRLNTYRNVAKHLGADLMMRHSKKVHETMIILDGGMIHQAQSLFAHPDKEFNFKEVVEFMRLVPMPDVLVHLQAPQELLISRTLARGHQRLVNKQKLYVQQYIRNAVRLTEMLVDLFGQKPVIDVYNDFSVTAPDEKMVRKITSTLVTIYTDSFQRK